MRGSLFSVTLVLALIVLLNILSQKTQGVSSTGKAYASTFPTPTPVPTATPTPAPTPTPTPCCCEF